MILSDTYQVGQSYLFSRAKYVGHNQRVFPHLPTDEYIPCSPYFKPIHRNMTIETILLSCTEHRHAINEQGDGAEFENFRFVDSEGRTWNSTFKQVSGGMGGNCFGQTVRKEQWTPDDGVFDGQWVDVSLYLAELKRNETMRVLKDADIEILRAHRLVVEDIIAEKYQRKTIYGIGEDTVPHMLHTFQFPTVAFNPPF